MSGRPLSPVLSVAEQHHKAFSIRGERPDNANISHDISVPMFLNILTLVVMTTAALAVVAPQLTFRNGGNQTIPLMLVSSFLQAGKSETDLPSSC